MRRIALPYFMLLIFVPAIIAQQNETKSELVYHARMKYRESVQFSLQKDYQGAVNILEKLLLTPGIEQAEQDLTGIFYALACNYSCLNEKEKALYYLEKAVDAGFADYEHLQEDKDLDNIRTAAGFKKIAEKLKRNYGFWENPAINTPYRENISEDEKIAGLAKLWSEVKYNFANFELVPEINWDSLFVATIPIVRKTESTFEYYRELEKLCAHLRDGHTGISYPAELRDKIAGRIPLQTRLIGDKVLVCEVYDEKLLKEGIYPGLEITGVNGMPAMEYAEKYIKPYQNDNTPQGLIRSTFEYSLLRGPLDEPLVLGLRDKKGNTVEKTLKRVRGYSTGRKDVEFKQLENNIGYVIINSFYSDEIVAQFDSVFAYIIGTDALIIDLRENGGGNGRVGWTILSYLTDKPITYHKWKSRKYRPIWRAWGRGEEWYEEAPGMWPADASKYYDKPVVLLTRDRTASMAENFCLGFDIMNRGEIIGGKTMGSSGTPLFFSLPGGGEGQVVTTRGMYPDGTEYTGVGVVPDIEVYQTIEDVRKGKDRILDTALDHLKKTIGK